MLHGRQRITKRLSRRCKLQLFSVHFKQLYVVAFFQPSDMLRHRRLRDIQLPGRLSKIQAFADLEKCFDPEIQHCVFLYLFSIFTDTFSFLYHISTYT